MMDQFVKRYIPGGMSLNHSGWWLCVQCVTRSGEMYEAPLRLLTKSDYK